MATCPKGHTSTATDYCDECGAADVRHVDAGRCGPAVRGTGLACSPARGTRRHRYAVPGLRDAPDRPVLRGVTATTSCSPRR